jgi:hypothetical protein
MAFESNYGAEDMARAVKKPTNKSAPASKRTTRNKTTARRTTRGTLSTKKKRMPTRPKKTAGNKKAASVDRQIKRDLRDKVLAMKAELKSAKQQRREAVKRERAHAQVIRAELKEALKRERALISLIDARDEAMRGFGNRWARTKIAQIQKPPKKRKRRKLMAASESET